MLLRTPFRAIALALATALALSACTAAEAEQNTNTSVRTSDPDAALAVITDVGASVATSRELFDAAPLVVLAPSGEADAQELSARAAVSLGVPLLIGPGADKGSDKADKSTPEKSGKPEKSKPPKNVDNPKSENDPTNTNAPPTPTPVPSGQAPGDDDKAKADKAKAEKAADKAAKAADKALSKELKRLGASTALVIGDVGKLAQDADDSAVSVTRVEATASAVTDATGLKLGKATAADPAGFAAGIAAFDPAKSGSHPPRDGLPRPKPAKPLADTLALAIDGVTQLGSIATARSAGVPLHLVPEGSANPQATASVIDALHASTTTKTLAIGAAFGAESALEWKVRSARSGIQLPGGGQLLFAQHQFVALYGTPSTSVLGVLGEQDATGAVQRARDVAAPYAALTDKTVVPMFEIIATVAAGGPGKDGNYSNELSVDGLRPWVDAAAEAGLYVVIDLQPGRTDFLTQAKQYQSLLELPNVGLALDPEWRLGPDQVPLRQIGSVSAAEVNTVTTWLADLTNSKGLPQKMLVLHQFRPAMISDRAALDLSRPEVAVLIHADGQGSQGAKQATWANLHRDAPAGVHWGWKNFYDEDLPMLTPEQTMGGVSPAPDLVTYQ